MKSKNFDDKILEYIEDIQKYKPDMVFKVSAQIAEAMINRINSPRDLSGLRNIYILFLLYAISTIDLMLFLRLFSTEYTACAALNNMKNYAISNDKHVNPNLHKIFREFYTENIEELSQQNLILIQKLLSQDKLEDVFMGACEYVIYHRIEQKELGYE
ncbi:MAG: hypothetical protein K2P99_01775 [Burkholderiales bacterium]|nr:hypothetical protein [Burkholderiales bacterium]